MSPLDAKDRSLWGRMQRWVVRYRWYVLAIGLAITAFSAAVSPTIHSNADPTAYIPRNRKSVRFWLKFNKRFGVLGTLMVGLEEPKQPFTIQGLRRVAAITGELQRHKADGILSVRSITNVQHMEKDETGTLQAGLLLPKLPANAAQRKKAMKRVLGDMQVPGALVSRDLRAYLILIQPDPRKDQRSIARLVQKTCDARHGNLRVFYFGAPFIANEVTRNVYRKLVWIAPLFILLLVGVIVVSIRHGWTIVVVLFAAGVTLVWWLAFMHVAGYPLTMTNVNAILLLLVIGVLVFARGMQARVSGTPHSFVSWALIIVGSVAFAGVAVFDRRTTVVLPYLALFGEAMALGLLAMAGTCLLVFLPLSTFIKPASQPVADPKVWPIRRSTAIWLLVLIGLFGLVGSIRIPFAVGLDDLFFSHGEVGRMLSFFDRRFGGHDFIQVSVRGDLRDPDTAARLMRATDLIEGTNAFADVRSITQVLGALTQGMGTYYRIPNTRKSLANIWFFLEGNRDVQPLVRDDRKEAMLALRIPANSNPPRLAKLVEKALRNSALQGKQAAVMRLSALLGHFHVDIPRTRVQQVVDWAAARGGSDEGVLKAVHAWMQSPDAPFTPKPTEWQQMAPLLKQHPIDVKALATAIATLDSFKVMGLPARVAGRMARAIVTQVSDIAIGLRIKTAMQRLFKGKSHVSGILKMRCKGVFADLLMPHTGPGKFQYHVSGFPLVRSAIASDLRAGVWRTAGILVALFLVFALFLAPIPWAGFSSVLDGLLAVMLTGALGWVTGIGVDSGSATLYLVPFVSAIFLSPGFYRNSPFEGRRYAAGFALGLAAAGLSIALAGVLPVVRVGFVMGVGLACAVLVTGLSRVLWSKH